MIKKQFSTFLFLPSALLLLILSCALRDNGVGIRNNPCDPGGENWKKNSSPIITVRADSLWDDFNHACTTGTIRLHLIEDDLNFPYDTVHGSIFVNSKEIKLPDFCKIDSISLPLKDIKPGISQCCSVVVFDSKHAITGKTLSLSIPASVPPDPPSGKITCSSQSVTISWPRITQANSYTVFYSDSLHGPYTRSIIVNQPDNNTITTITFNDRTVSYFPRYYILSSVNKYGLSRSKDTLLGRIYSANVPTPSISSISQGTYDSYISISSYINYPSNLDHIEIYRSINDTNSFRLAGKVKTSGNYSYIYFNDSVSTSSNCYYRLAAIDKQGRCSFPSSVSIGYLYRLSSPYPSITNYPEYIRLTWYSISNAVCYHVYRSSISCYDSLVLIGSTTITSYSDTPSTSDNFYYVVRAVSRNNNEGLNSSCVQGRISVLPSVDSITVTNNFYPKSVALSWKKLTGADGYIIYRRESGSGSGSTTIDTVSTTSLLDSSLKPIIYYYKIAAFNKRGIGTPSTDYSGSVIIPKILSSTNQNDSMSITFSPLSRAIKYYIYSSPDTTGFVLIDSVNTSSYIAILKDFKTFYYRITIRVPEGMSYPSDYVPITRNLSTPVNVKATDLKNGVLLQWNSVRGAANYQIYRSSYQNGSSLYSYTLDTFFVDTLPEGSSRYYYRIGAVNGMVSSDLSADVNGGRIGIPLTPTSFSISPNVLYLYLHWSMPSGGSNPTGFKIYRSTYNGQFVLIDSTKSYFYNDSVPDSLSYYYRISAYNSQGESPMCATNFSARTKPSAPTNVTASIATSKDYIHIYWSPVTSITQYGVYRATSTTNNLYYYIGTAKNSTEYFDSTCEVNTNYYYVVNSLTPGNRSMGSAYTVGIRLGPPEITGVTTSGSGIIINWNKPSYTIYRYYIYKATSPSGPYTKIDSTNATSYYVANYDINSYFKISTFNVVESDLSIEATTALKQLPPAPKTVEATQGTVTNMITLRWAASLNADGYRIYRSPTDTFNRGVTLIRETTEIWCVDTVYSDSMYYYRVKAFNKYGENDTVSGTSIGFRRPSRSPYPPTGTYIWPNKDGIFIGWDIPSTAVGYNDFILYRSKSANGPFEIVTTTTDRFYTDVPPEKSPTVYWYEVIAENPVGMSSPSKMVSGSQLQ